MTKKVISRRSFIFALPTIGLTGCSAFGYRASLFSPPHYTCSLPSTSNINIDIHCHIFNIQDIDHAAYLSRRYVNVNRDCYPLAIAASSLSSIMSFINHFTLKDIKSENEWANCKLKQLFGTKRIALSSSPSSTNKCSLTDSEPSTTLKDYNFCDAASNEQRGLIFNESAMFPGMFSNRARNVAKLLNTYPDVDIFTPSLVDFHDESWASYSLLDQQMELYSTLNLLTLGRILPMVSYHPGRKYINEETRLTPIQMVRDAIENKGFVGVKIHPSSGFSPENNFVNGCPNHKFKKDDWEPHELAYTMRLDSNMQEIFEYCRLMDVPILIHSGPTTPTNASCMRRKQSNHPEKWAKAIAKVNKQPYCYRGANKGKELPEEHKLRVCLGHFAGGFPDSAFLQEEENQHAQSWLEAALDNLDRGLYLDTSAMGEWMDDDKWKFRKSTAIKLNSLLQNNNADSHVLYGTDWHVPNATIFGNSYFTEISNAIKNESHRKKVMGLNAVEFLGLRKGRLTRSRLEDFYRKNGLKIDNVAWIKKIDS